MTTVVLVRHGQSEGNIKKVFAGQTDVPLTALGKRQAEEVAVALDRYRFDKIYSSDLSRAHNTAAPTAKRQGLEIISEPGFREIRVGEWEMTPFADMLNKFPITYRYWKEDLYLCCPEGGETVQELIARIYATFDRVVAENRGKTILVTSHATPIRVLTARAMGLPPERVKEAPWAYNTSITVITVEDDGTLHMPVQNDYSHLSSESTIVLE